MSKERECIAAWTPPGNSPPYFNATNHGDHCIEITVRGHKPEDKEYGDAITISMSYLQFDSIAHQIAEWRAKEHVRRKIDAPFCAICGNQRAHEAHEIVAGGFPAPHAHYFKRGGGK